VSRCPNGPDQAPFLELKEEIEDTTAIRQILTAVDEVKMVNIDILPIEFFQRVLEIPHGVIPCFRTRLGGNDGFVTNTSESFPHMAFRAIVPRSVEEIYSQIERTLNATATFFLRQIGLMS
jgi:hypothetical protein